MSTCARCNSELGKGLNKPITQNLCDLCTGYLELQEVADICEYLENLPAPILVVDGENAVRGANSEACRMVSKDLPRILNLRGGDVFECAHARLPGGCGRTVHCSGCTLRRAILETLSTGQPQSGITVTVRQKAASGEDRHVPFQIATQRMANCVLLQIQGGF